MTKERRTVSIDPEVQEYLDRDGVNASQLVNRLVQSHFTMGGDKQAMLEMRKQQLESDIEELEGRIKSKEKELEKVRAELDDMNDVEESVIREAAEKIDPTMATADNPGVKNWAEKAGTTPEELIDRMEEYW